MLKLSTIVKTFIVMNIKTVAIDSLLLKHISKVTSQNEKYL